MEKVRRSWKLKNSYEYETLAMPKSSQERGIKGMGCEKLFCDNRVELIRD